MSNGLTKVSMGDIREMFLSIHTLIDENIITDKNFAYALVKNLSRIKIYAQDIVAVERIGIQLSDQRILLLREVSDKDQNGAVVLKNGRTSISNITPENKKTLDDIEAKMRINKSDSEEFFSKTVEVDFYKIDFKCIPDNIKPKDLAAISFFIKGMNDE